MSECTTQRGTTFFENIPKKDIILDDFDRYMKYNEEVIA